MIDDNTFRFLINLVASGKLDMHLMDLVTAYPYGSFDINIYLKIPEGFKILEALKSKDHNLCSIKLQRSFYGLKKFGCMWYNHLTEYLIKKRIKNDPLCLCIFIRKSEYEFTIIAVYIDDMNINWNS